MIYIYMYDKNLGYNKLLNMINNLYTQEQYRQQIDISQLDRQQKGSDLEQFEHKINILKPHQIQIKKKFEEQIKTQNIEQDEDVILFEDHNQQQNKQSKKILYGNPYTKIPPPPKLPKSSKNNFLNNRSDQQSNIFFAINTKKQSQNSQIGIQGQGYAQLKQSQPNEIEADQMSFNLLEQKKIINQQIRNQALISQPELQIPSVAKPQPQPICCKGLFLVQRILFFPQKFHLLVDGKHRLTARRKLVHSNSLYFFFTDSQQLSTKGPNYVAYMESNYDLTQYHIYTASGGVNLAQFNYLMKQQGKPPQIRVYVSGRPQRQWKPVFADYQQQKRHIDQISGSQQFQSQKSRDKFYFNQSQLPKDINILCMQNRLPTFNQLTKKFSQNFMGRAKCSSIKNCILQPSPMMSYNNYNNHTLIMGKQSEKNFNLDFGWPFSQITAFGFAIANYEDKQGKSGNEQMNN